MAEITVHLIDADGTRRDVPGRAGQSLMRAAVEAGIDAIKADCGGLMSCATCHVIVATEWVERLPPLSSDEDAMLEMTAVPREPTSRLSCQIDLDTSLDGLTARLPATQY